MANEYRGEVPFTALGREMYLAYGIRELAELKAALGFRMPDHLLPPSEEDVAEVVPEKFIDGKLQKDGRGRVKTKVITRRAVVDYKERRRRVDDAFGEALEQPGVDGLLVMLRYGLRRWEKATATRLDDGDFDKLWDELGFEQLLSLHYKAVRRAFRVPDAVVAAVEDEDPNGSSAARVPSTSTLS